MTSVWTIIRQQHRAGRLFFWLGLAVALVPSVAGLLLLGVAGWFITAAAVAGTTGVFLNIFAPSALIRAFAILRTAGRYGERVVTHDATFRFLTGFRNRLFSAMAARGGVGRRSGLLLNRLTLDISALDAIYLRLVVPLAVAVAVAVGALLLWSSLSTALLIAGAAFLALWAGLALHVLFRCDKATAIRSDAALDAMRLRATDLAAGRRDLAIYGGREAVAASVLEADRRLALSEEIEDRRAQRLSALAAFAGQAFLAIALLVCADASLTGTLSPALAIGLLLVVMGLPEIFAMTLPGFAKLPRTMLACRRILALGAADTTAAPGADGEAVRRQSKGPILSFSKVVFRYPGAERDVVENLSFDVRHGEVVALSGRSGCGKSTVAALAARLRRPAAGCIRLEGEDLGRFGEVELRAKITVIGQWAYLFNDTVAENLRIANPEASDEQLWQALQQAALSGRIAEGREGLNAVLGERGLGLSGGEQRRLALARAFLTAPDLFILDEMTEGLDASTAADVLDRFFAFKGKASVLMIAHRQQELVRADRVVVLDTLS
ncbi:thiol reductant ABC exporter subunit CydC [Roseibium sp. M-1]